MVMLQNVQPSKRKQMNKLTINYRGQSLTMHATKENLKELVNKGTELLLGDHLEYSSEHELGNMNINEGNIYVSYLIGVLKEKLSVEYKGSLSAHELMLIFIN